MTKWSYVEPGDNGEPVVKTFTEEEIIKDFYPWWSERMRKVGKDHLISEANCIEDWVVVHWAMKVENEHLCS